MFLVSFSFLQDKNDSSSSKSSSTTDVQSEYALDEVRGYASYL